MQQNQIYFLTNSTLDNDCENLEVIITSSKNITTFSVSTFCETKRHQVCEVIMPWHVQMIMFGFSIVIVIGVLILRIEFDLTYRRYLR